MSVIAFVQVVLDVAPQPFEFPLPLLLALVAFLAIVVIVFISRYKRRGK